MDTPVAFIIFNRPDLTERVFTEIARAQPKKLLVVADGPRPERPGEAEKCAAARAVIRRVDWNCEVLKDYSDVNLGCAHRPASGLRWIFEQVDEAIILEDDCVPHPTFFRFCEELLDKYRDDERVMHISGANFITGQARTPYSYSFSRYCLSWGWASWRRAFQHYDLKIQLWPELRETPWLLDILGDPRAVEHWTQIFDRTHSGVEKVNTWDFQWVFTCWAQLGLSILSNTNLVSNVGFREDATHTRRTADRRANIATNEIAFPLKHPAYVARDRQFDQLLFEQVVLSGQRSSLQTRLQKKCTALIPDILRRPLADLRSRWTSLLERQ
jgi:hypothetical protein